MGPPAELGLKNVLCSLAIRTEANLTCVRSISGCPQMTLYNNQNNNDEKNKSLIRDKRIAFDRKLSVTGS